MRGMNSTTYVLLLVVFMAQAMGCESKPKMGPLDLTVTLDENSLRMGGVLPSIEVDIVGCNSHELDAIGTYAVGQYFAPNDVIRKDAAKHTMRFSNEDSGSKTLGKGDPIWQTWKNEDNLIMIIMANLPPVPGASTGVGDPRRLIIDFEKLKPEGDVMRIQIQKSGVKRVSKMNPRSTK